MQERKWITVLIPAVLLFGITSFASPAAAGSAKVEVCHFPPGNPDNFHTITISENAFSKHLAHGDLGGPCNALCATICDDENACTIDDTADCEEVGCPTSSSPVDCNDANECTADSCVPASGCVNTATDGVACDDEQVCSGPDTCNAEGACQGEAIDNCCLGDEDCSQDLCDQASCDLVTNRCGNDPVVCDPPNLCTMSECASDTGQCVEAAVVCGAGETCDLATGDCVPDVICPCWTQTELDNIGGDAGTPPDTCRITGANNGTARIFEGNVLVGPNNLIRHESAVVKSKRDSNGAVVGHTCHYLERTPLTQRIFDISDDEYIVCLNSIIAACEDRGTPLFP